MEVRMSTSANGTKLSSVLATLGWLAKPCKVSPATAAASMIPRNLVAPAGDAPLDGVVDELLAHEQGAAARREQPLAHQLRDGARNGLTAGPDLIGELLLRGTISNQEPFRSRRSVLAADRDQTRDDPLLDTGQRQPGGQLLRAFETLDQPGPQDQRQLRRRPQTSQERLARYHQKRRSLHRLPVVGKRRLRRQGTVGDQISSPKHFYRDLASVHRAANGPNLPTDYQDRRVEPATLRHDGRAPVERAQRGVARQRFQRLGRCRLKLRAGSERLQRRCLDRYDRPHQLTVGIEIECRGCHGHARLLGLRPSPLRNRGANGRSGKLLRIFGPPPRWPDVTWRPRHPRRENRAPAALPSEPGRGLSSNAADRGRTIRPRGPESAPRFTQRRIPAARAGG